MRLMTVGALRPPFWDLIPVETGALSVYPILGSWQDAQLSVSSADSLRSKYNNLPRSAFAFVYGLSFGQLTGGRPSGGFGGISAAQLTSKKAGSENAPARILRVFITRSLNYFVNP